MTQELYDRLTPFASLMRQIIINSAASNLPIEYKTVLQEVGNQLGIHLSCNCSSGWFTLTSKLYAEYLKYTNELNEPHTTEVEIQPTSTNRRRSKRNTAAS